MTAILLIVGLLLLNLIKRVKMDLTSRRMLNLFVMYWILSIVLASLHVYNLRDINSFTYVLLYLNVFSFCFGFLFVARKRKDNISVDVNDVSKQMLRVSDSVFYKIVLIGASIYTYTLLVVFFGKIMFYGTLSDVRTDYFEGEMYGPFFAQINTFILQPIYLITLPIFAYLCLYKRNWTCLVAGFYLFGYASISGGRLDYVRIAISILFIAYCILRTFKDNKRRGYAVAVVGAVIMFLLLVLVSGARMGEIGNANGHSVGVQTAAEHLITYTAGPIAAFDYSIENDYSKFVNGYQYGNLTLTQVISAINLFTSRLGFRFPIALDTFVEYKQEMYISIAPDLNYWNALYTSNLYFFNDFGVFGVILFPFLFGLLISSLINKMYKYNSFPLLVILCFCFWCMMSSVLDYFFVSPYVFITLVILYIIGTRKKYLLNRVAKKLS